MQMTSQTKVDIASIVGGGYGDFWRFKGRYRICKGSRMSKKSKTTALNFIVRMMEYPDANLVVIRAVANTLKDSCFADLAWAARRLGVSHLWRFPTGPSSALEATYLPTGQKILGRGLDDPQRLASISVARGVLCWAWIEEAYEIDLEADFDMVDDLFRGEVPEGLFKQLTLTFNPWSADHWLKRRFFDCAPYPDLLAKTTNYLCNEFLDQSDIDRFERMKAQNPTRYKVAGLGDWGIDGAVFFEEFVNDPQHYKDRVNTHVIDPFEVPNDWRIYRSFDFGYAKPFSVGWWTVDPEGRIYRILELYGCTEEPNTGLKWTPKEIFTEVKTIEAEHRWLRGKHIYGVADPSIWDASRGESIAETGEKMGIYFEPGDNKRLPGWMQMHYRMQFDEHGLPMMYIFNTCRAFLRTIPVLKYDDVKPEDIDTDQEDHVADEARYLCMARPYTPKDIPAPKARPYSPLDNDSEFTDNQYNFYKLY